MSSIKTPLQRLTEIETEIRIEEAKLPKLLSDRGHFQKELPSNCNFALKSKREACEDDRAWKLTKINVLTTQINTINNRIKRLSEERDVLELTQGAQNEATVNLSQDGLNFEAMVIQAQGEAQANLEIAEAKSDAIIKETTSKGDALKDDADTRKKLLIGGGVLVGVIAIVVIAVIVKSRMN